MQEQVGEVERLGEDWAAAELGGVSAELGEILADDFVGVGPRGFMLTRDQWLSRHETRSLRHFEINGQFRATLVFVKQEGRWQLAGLQLSPILGSP